MTSPPQQHELRRRLAEHGQQHLLTFWGDLSLAQQASLAAEIANLNLPQLARLAKQATGDEDYASLARRAVPPPAVTLTDATPERRAEARRLGKTALDRGELGVLLVAGGQGTRLGFDKPKGMFPIGPLSQATLFEILIGKVVALGRRHRQRIPLYLMTSPATHAETVEFLAAHDRFGLSEEDLHIFCQGTMPAVDAATGQVLLAEKHALALSPDGHGGMLTALAASGDLADAVRRGLKHLFYLQVDNPLVPIGDPEFIGYHLESGSEVSTQAIRKQTPLERVGNIVSIDGQVRIIEYSDLPEEVARLEQPDGSLRFGPAALPCIYLPSISSSGWQLARGCCRSTSPARKCRTSRPRAAVSNLPRPTRSSLSDSSST